MKNNRIHNVSGTTSTRSPSNPKSIRKGSTPSKALNYLNKALKIEEKSPCLNVEGGGEAAVAITHTKIIE